MNRHVPTNTTLRLSFTGHWVRADRHGPLFHGLTAGPNQSPAESMGSDGAKREPTEVSGTRLVTHVRYRAIH